MDIMTLIIIVAFGVLNVLSFTIGARIGQAIVKGQEIKTPEINPLKAYREHEAHKAQAAEQSRLDAILQNIESYNGTEQGQKDVPGGG